LQYLFFLFDSKNNDWAAHHPVLVRSIAPVSRRPACIVGRLTLMAEAAAISARIV
jgi:hypothetical protein